MEGKNIHGQTTTFWLSHKNGPNRFVWYLATPTVYSLNWEPQDLVVGLKQVKVVITYQYLLVDRCWDYKRFQQVFKQPDYYTFGTAWI